MQLARDLVQMGAGTRSAGDEIDDAALAHADASSQLGLTEIGLIQLKLLKSCFNALANNHFTIGLSQLK